MPAHKAPVLQLWTEHQRELNDLVRAHSTPQQLAERARADQGVQFTSAGFLDELQPRGVRVSMDDRGRFLDNIFIEPLWRNLKYEDIFIKAYETVAAARAGIDGWLTFYNDERPHRRWAT